jgi:hypothetical protein
LALRNWLPLILHYVDPWLSQQDIQAGDRWSVEIGNELNESHFGIICLTAENLTMPWILFEAGAISKSFPQGAVCPYLYDLDYSAITGPLQQFQGKKADRTSTKELVESINSKSTTPITSARLDTLFETLWPRLEDQLSTIPGENIGLQRPRPQSDILEDLVKSVRAMEGSVRELSNIINNRHEIGRMSTWSEDNEPHIKFTIIVAESVGALKVNEKFTLLGPPVRLLGAIASQTGLASDEYGFQWHLREAKTSQVLTSHDILELGNRYPKGGVCVLSIENGIPF